jgi:hypothetical protein
MNAAATEALKGLREIPLPPPVSFRPATVGWAAVGVLLLAVAAYAAWRAWRRWQANAYRRAALRELADIEARLGGAGTRGPAAAALPALVKRTALACFPRERVAPTTEDEWLAFLDRTCPPGGFVAGPGKLLPRIAYAADLPADAELRDLTALVRRWIERHDAHL